MRPEFTSYEDWANHLVESGHGPENLMLRELIGEMKQKNPDVIELARRMFGDYNEFNQYYDDKVDENGALTPEGIELVYKEAARRALRERNRQSREPQIKKVKGTKEKPGEKTPITDLISKHGLRQSANITVLDKSGKSGRYRVDFVRPAHGNQRPEVVQSIEGTPTEIDEFLSNTELRRELDRRLGL